MTFEEALQRAQIRWMNKKARALAEKMRELAQGKIKVTNIERDKDGHLIKCRFKQ